MKYKNKIYIKLCMYVCIYIYIIYIYIIYIYILYIYIYIFAIIKKCAVPVRPRGNLRAHCFHDYIYILHTYI